MSSGASMDEVSLDEWELLPDHKSSFFMEECSNGHDAVGGKDQLLFGAKLVMINMDHFGPTSYPAPYDCILDEEAMKRPLPTSEDAYAHDPITEFKDIGVVQAESKQEELSTEVTEILISDTEEEEELMKTPAGVKEVDRDEVLVEVATDDQCADDEGRIKKIGFTVGNLRVNGVGALCSFGVAAATFCIFLLGGNQQQQQKRQNHKIQLQMYADDERIHQVVQQASRLKQTMSSVMGGPSSTRATISFGGYYNGF